MDNEAAIRSDRPADTSQSSSSVRYHPRTMTTPYYRCGADRTAARRVRVPPAGYVAHDGGQRRGQLKGFTMIAPEVGRHVHFYPHESQYAFGFNTVAGKPHAAIVTWVHGPRMVNLCVFDANGRSFHVTSCTLVQPGEPDPTVGSYCKWMPYTIDKAAQPAA